MRARARAALAGHAPRQRASVPPAVAAPSNPSPYGARAAARADVNGVYTGECTTYALSGFIRGQGEADAALERLWLAEMAARPKLI